MESGWSGYEGLEYWENGFKDSVRKTAKYLRGKGVLKMLLTKILGFIVPIILGMLGKMADRLNQKNLEKGEEEKEEEEYSYIAIGLIIICGIYSFVNIFTDDVIFSGLLWIQNHWLIAGIYIFGVAVLPSVVAEKERGKGVFWAKEDYTVQNRKHNIRGGGCLLFSVCACLQPCERF